MGKRTRKPGAVIIGVYKDDGQAGCPPSRGFRDARLVRWGQAFTESYSAAATRPAASAC